MARNKLPIPNYHWLVIVGLVALLSACASPTPATTNTPVAAPTVATATPIGLTRPNVQDTTRGQSTNCGLVTRQDMGGMFAAEVNQPIYNANATNVLPFSNERVSADEYACVYLAFHNSGAASGNSYQVTYWVDKPGQTPASQWAQVWNDAKLGNAQPVLGVGDDAFYREKRLTFKKGDVYVTVEVLDSKTDTDTPEGMNHQIELEKKVALKALTRWQ